MKYTLRQAREDDFEFLYNLKVTCLKEYVAATYGWDDEYQLQLFTKRFDPSEIQIIVVDDHDVGHLSVEDSDDELYIAGIYLLPAWQNQGLGTSVIEDVLSTAAGREKGGWLQVLRVNPARHLYERLGFQIFEETNTHFKMRWQKNQPE
jgi:ribosomal protein S18 acetylase RimI-like enzyme